MQIMFNGKEYTTEVNKYGHHICGGELVSVDGVNIVDPRFTFPEQPEPTYTEEDLRAMTHAQRDELFSDLEGWSTSLTEAEEVTLILEALGL